MKSETGTLGLIVEKDVPVTMRDGVTLSANVFRPDSCGSYPGLLLRTPYGKPTDGFERYVRAGYAVVTQDSRGRYASDGKYIPFTESNTGDAEDGYDSVEWLAAHPVLQRSGGYVRCFLQRVDAMDARATSAAFPGGYVRLFYTAGADGSGLVG